MRNLWLSTILLGWGPLLFGQLDSGSLTVTAARTIYLQPDQAVIGVAVISGLDGSLEEILGSIADTGISEADFSGVSGFHRRMGPGLRWDFNLTVPLARLSETLALLRGQPLTYAVRGAQVSPATRNPESCSQANLVADAITQARRMALAAGVALSPVLAVAEGGSIGNSAQGGFALSGDFSAAPVGQISFSTLSASSPIVCSLTVKFNIGH